MRRKIVKTAPFKDTLEKLEALAKELGQTAVGYRLRREVISIVKHYEKDAELVKAFRDSGDRKQLLQVSRREA